MECSILFIMINKMQPLPLDLENIIFEYLDCLEQHDKYARVVHQFRFIKMVDELSLILSCCFEKKIFVVGLCLALIAELKRENMLYSD